MSCETLPAWCRRHNGFSSADICEGHESVASPRARSLSSGGDRRSCDRRSGDGGDTELGLIEAGPRHHPNPGARPGHPIDRAEQARPSRHILSPTDRSSHPQ